MNLLRIYPSKTALIPLSGTNQHKMGILSSKVMRNIFEYIRKYKFLLLIIIPALLIYMLVIFPSGSYYCFEKECGYYFWGAHGRDAIWHLSIAELSFNKIPFANPAYAGGILTGYNWLLDFFIFFLSKLGIPPIISYFKLIPTIWFVLFTTLVIHLGRKIKDTPLFVGLFLFLNYFGGSFSYLLKLYHTGSIQDSSVLLPQPIIHSMSNLQYAISLLFFLAILILIKDQVIHMKRIILIGVLIFFVLGIKFYGGAISIFLVFMYLFTSLLKHPNKAGKYLSYFIITVLFILTSIVIFYNPFVSAKTGFPFSISPFALVHPITEAPDQFYLEDMTNARYFLQSKIGPRLIAIELINLAIFLLFYFGTRFLGLLYLISLSIRKKISQFDAIVVPTIIFSVFLTVFLVQKGVWWNTIQFFFYAIFLSTIYLTTFAFDLLKKKKKFFLLLGFILILLSIPTSYDVIWHYVNESKPVYLPKEEIEALAFLKKQPEGVVLSPLYIKKWKKNYRSFPLNHFDDSSYVAAFSGKQLYFAEEQTLEVTGISTKSRLEKVKKKDCSILSEVDYVYELRAADKSDNMMNKCKKKNAKKIFLNNSVIIYSL